MLEGEDVTWDLQIDGSGEGAISLDWGDMSSLLPNDYSAWLMVQATGEAVNMFEVAAMEINQALPVNVQIIISSTFLSLSDILGLPTEYAVHQNYPNPFNPVTTLRYDLPEDGMVNITIYDMMGRVVRTMVNTQQNAGFKSVQWNATNNMGQSVSAGLYLYTIQAGEFRQTKKMVLLK